jgi:single-stranded-DNA-specific exonuclease
MAEVDPEQDFKVVVTEETGGLAGLIAGRVAGATGRPAAILTRRVDDSYGGSARAGDTDVDLYGALYAVRHLMGEWGGHRKAAGLSVKPGNLDAFVAGVNEEIRAQGQENPEIFAPAIEVDAEIPLESVSNGLLDWHEKLAPFGSGNHRPVFASEGLKIEGSRQLVGGDEPREPRRRRQGEDGRRRRRAAGGSFDAAYTVSRSRTRGGRS